MKNCHGNHNTTFIIFTAITNILRKNMIKSEVRTLLPENHVTCFGQLDPEGQTPPPLFGKCPKFWPFFFMKPPLNMSQKVLSMSREVISMYNKVLSMYNEVPSMSHEVLSMSHEVRSMSHEVLSMSKKFQVCPMKFQVCPMKYVMEFSLYRNI